MRRRTRGGGLPISDAGGLDLDAKLANTNEITVARMGALTDWINSGRLDLILDIIAADVVGIDGAAMRGTDSANTTTPLTAAQVNTEVDNALNTAIPGGPTADSINQRILAIDDLTQAAGGGDLAAVLGDTSELQADWVNGGRLDLLIDAILLDTGTTLDGKINTIDDFLDTEIAAIKVVTDKLDSAQAEPGQATPAVNETPLVKLAYLFKQWRNKSDNDGSTSQLYNDDTTTVDQKRAVSQSGGTVTKNEVAAGP